MLADRRSARCRRRRAPLPRAPHPHPRRSSTTACSHQFLSRIVSPARSSSGIGTPEEPRRRDRSPHVGRRPPVRRVRCRPSPGGSAAQVRWSDLAVGAGDRHAARAMGCSRTLDEVAGRARVELNIVNEVNFMASLMWMVSSGLGVSIVPSALRGLRRTSTTWWRDGWWCVGLPRFISVVTRARPFALACLPDLHRHAGTRPARVGRGVALDRSLVLGGRALAR